MPPMILTAEEDCHDPHDLCSLIDLEIKHRALLGHVPQPRTDVIVCRALMGRRA